ARPGDDVGDRVGDVGRFQPFEIAEAAFDFLQHLGPVVGGELGDHGARLDQRDAHVALGDFLAERLGEGADAELGRVVDGGAGAGTAAGDGGDVDQVGDHPRRLVGGLDQVRERRLGDVEEAFDVDVDHL